MPENQLDSEVSRGRRRGFPGYRVTPAWLASLLAIPPALAGSLAVVPDDSNSRVEVAGARVADGATTVVYYTWPDLGDPNSGKPCPLNFYAVRLQPGLAQAAPATLATGVCGFAGTRAAVLADGDLLILAKDRLERWHGNARAFSRSFADLDATRDLGLDGASGGQMLDLSEDGHSVAVVPRAGSLQGSSGDFGAEVVALDAEGRQRWRAGLHPPGKLLTVYGIWAGDDGGALVYANASAADNSTTATENLLYPIDPAGRVLVPVVITVDKALDMQALSTLKPEDMSRLGEMMQDAYLEGVKRLDVFPEPGGGFDVLLHRTSGGAGREGHFLFHIGSDGQSGDAQPLTDAIESHGLENWADFQVEGGRLILLSQVIATQAGVQARRTTYPQGAVSWLPLDGGQVNSRLLPLDRRYLEAAMNAGDEDLQHLDNRPGGEPALLSRLGGAPLAIAVGYLQGRYALRFDEASQDLPAWTEAFDRRQADAASAAAKARRDSEQQARRDQYDADMAAAVGMTPEQYQALSNKERKAAMLESGNLEGVLAAAANQAEAMQPPTEANGQAVEPEDLEAQLAAAMQEARAAMEAAGIDPAALGIEPAGGAVAAAAGAQVTSAERGTPEQAKALVARAIAEFDRAGRKTAFGEFEDPAGGFIQRDLYVFVFGPDRTIVAHGGDAGLVGTPADSLRDVDGAAFGTRFMDESSEQGSWMDYKWQDPVSGRLLPKSSWVVQHDGYVFGVGVYRP